MSTPPLTTRVLGGYGNFGARITRRLARVAGLRGKCLPSGVRETSPMLMTRWLSP